MSLKREINKWLKERHPDQSFLLADGFEEAFVGVAYQFDKPLAIFDREKCIEILTKDMTADEAEEYFQYNVEGAYVGIHTPMFLDKFKKAQRNKRTTKK